MKQGSEANDFTAVYDLAENGGKQKKRVSRKGLD